MENISSNVCTLVDVFHQMVTFRVQNNQKDWLCSAIYASPTPSIRENLWHYMMQYKTCVNIPWFLMGDFNQVLSPAEAKGCLFSAARADYFAHVLDVCDLMDIGLTRNTYTWVRRAAGTPTMMKRLDRALASLTWRHLFPEAYIEVLGKLHSDHFPLLLRCEGQQLVRGERPIRFLAAWTTHPDYDTVVDTAWHRGDQIVVNCLAKVKEDSLVFNKDVFGNILYRKRRLETRLQGIQRRLEQVDFASLIRLEEELQREYNLVLYQEELLWYQKSRERWVKLGDRNTSFFHSQTIVRRKRNRIHGLFLDDGRWITDDAEL